MASVEARYRKQFLALDSLLSRMNSTSSYLASQLSSLPKPSSG
jgi:flagellar hook-associated protein 2